MSAPAPDPLDLRVLAPAGLREAHGAAEAAWRHGYVWARLGRYDHAWWWWEQAARRGLAARVRGSRAAVLRELGLHTDAEDEDRAGLDVVAVSWERAALAIGLVADAVGAGDVERARRLLGEANRAVAMLEGSLLADRQRIRVGWVEVEVAMLAREEASPPLPQLQSSGWRGRFRRRGWPHHVEVPPVYRAGSVHHLAKGLLLRGVLSGDVATLERALEAAPPGLAWAVHLACVDLGVAGALRAAARSWQAIVPPAAYAERVAATPTAQRLSRPTPQ